MVGKKKSKKVVEKKEPTKVEKEAAPDDIEEPESRAGEPQAADKDEAAESNNVSKKAVKRAAAPTNNQDEGVESNNLSKKAVKRAAAPTNNQENSSARKLRIKKAAVAEASKDDEESAAKKPEGDVSGREYEVEAIVGKRRRKGTQEFLVKWKGYEDKDNSWLPKRNLNCQRLLQEFLESEK